MKSNNALVLVFSRNAFYKRLHYLALGAFGLSLLVIAILIGLLVYLLRSPVHPLYFATDSVSRFIEVLPVTKPNMTLEDVSAWTVSAVEAAYSYDYLNYRSQLQEAQRYFTNYGWSHYMRALKTSNNLIALTERKFVVTAKVVTAPKLIAQDIVGGAYAWKFEMPVLVTYSEPPYDQNSVFSNPLTVTVIVQRQQALQGFKGLGILQMIGTFTTTNTAPRQISGTTTG
jgi:intracellular multiplication protein IcmL